MSRCRRVAPFVLTLRYIICILRRHFRPAASMPSKNFWSLFSHASQACFSIDIRVSLLGAAATGLFALTFAFALKFVPFAALAGAFVAGGVQADRAKPQQARADDNDVS